MHNSQSRCPTRSSFPSGKKWMHVDNSAMSDGGRLVKPLPAAKRMGRSWLRRSRDLFPCSLLVLQIENTLPITVASHQDGCSANKHSPLTRPPRAASA